MRFFHRRHPDDQLVEEIETHLSLQEDEYRRAGMSDRDARDAARRAFGGEVKTRQLYREQRRWGWLATLRQDASFGLRVLLRDRAFALTAVCVLGLGIGVNNMQFTIIYAHTLRGLPIADASRVLMASLADERGVDRGLSYVEYTELAAGADRLDPLAALGPATSVALGDAGRAPDRYLAVYTTRSAFDTLRIQPAFGRSFTRDEEQPGAARVAMLGAGAWRARYNGDVAMVGREVLINGDPTTVVGIVPEHSGFPSTAEVFLPLGRAPALSPVQRDARLLRAFGRVRPDASVDEARAQLTTLLTQVAAASGNSTGGLLPSVDSISSRFLGRATDPAWIAFFAVGFLVVAVASANAANLMLSRGVQRAREIAIRGSLGASRGRVVAQLLVESLVIALLGSVIGLLVSVAGVRLFQSSIPANSMPYWWRYSMDFTVFAALVLVSVSTVLIFGLVPALHASNADVSRVLKDGGWTGSGRRTGRRLTTFFMTAQLALSAVLMSYVIRDLVAEDESPASDAVLATTEVLTASFSLPAGRYPGAAERAAFLRQLRERTHALPGVTSVTVASALPRDGATEQRLEVAPGRTREQLPVVWSVLIGPEYFETLRLPIQRGREFSINDAAAGASPALVNQRFADVHFGATDPIGQNVTLLPADARDDSRTVVTIVGVTEDIRHRPGRVEPVLYLPITASTPPTVALMIRSTVDTERLTAQLRDAVLALDANLPLFQVITLDAVLHNAEWNARVSSRLVTALSVIVLILSAVGMYAVTAHAVSQRAKEIGIRMAVGARPAQIRQLVARRAIVQMMLGLLLGAALTMAWHAAFFDGRVDARLVDPVVLLALAAVFAGVTALSCVAPMRRATEMNPISILRQD